MFKYLLTAALLAISCIATSSAQSDLSGLVIKSVVLGSHATSRNTVAIPKNLFKASETICLSVETEAIIPSLLPGTLAVNWTYSYGNELMVVESESTEVTTVGLTHTLFQIAKPDGWPTGDYHVELFLDGQSVRQLDFSVR